MPRKRRSSAGADLPDPQELLDEFLGSVQSGLNDWIRQATADVIARRRANGWPDLPFPRVPGGGDTPNGARQGVTPPPAAPGSRRKAHADDFADARRQHVDANASPHDVDRYRAAEVLGVQPNAPREVIEAAYKALVFANHPDRGGDAKKMVEINKAKRVLLQ